MGLFKKKTCCLCGQPKGLLGTKLADGNCLCAKCQNTGKEQGQVFGMKSFPRRACKKLTLVEFKKNRAMLEKSRRKIAKFKPTVTYCNIVHIDEDRCELVFANDITSLKKSPEQNRIMVHNLHNLVFRNNYYLLNKVKEGLLNDYVIADIVLLVAFDEPFAKLYAVTLRKNVKLRISGAFKKTYEPDPECTKLIDYLDQFLRVGGDREGLFWEAVSCAKQEQYLESSDVADLLKSFYSGDKAKIKGARKRYRL